MKYKKEDKYITIPLGFDLQANKDTVCQQQKSVLFEAQL